LATGFAFMPMALGMFAMTRVVPRLLSRLGPRPLALTGTVTMVCGLVWLSQVDASSTYWSSIFGPMLMMGVGGGLSFVPLSPVIFATVPPKDAGAAGGVLQTMQQTGATLGLAVLVSVYGAALRTAGPIDHAAAMVHAMTRAFAVSAGIAGVTILVATTFRQMESRATATAAQAEDERVAAR
jgi:MFS family permease